MMLKSISLLALLPVLGACNPVPEAQGRTDSPTPTTRSMEQLLKHWRHLGLEARQSCLVNREKINMWVENGLTRWRIAFSSEGTETKDYCEYWMNGKDHDGCTGHHNPQCWFKKDLGTWVVDASTTRGMDQEFWSCHEFSLKAWIRDTGCRTG
ncbi:hypothetical protein FZEAL_7626 [Fusarium zealandicum]|uniref:Uncharacterized protein n=1 Tax=Fusarium zealandicum TaxID=1053134 RepID=A0A8H4UFK3_9HYPO|nr:hypothetical protein FZEAL_7626 [Fusarium zealandicum]